ncbi:MAG: hypothetical protein ACRDP6_11690 [Actinoallomurus sp.]
MYVVETDIDTVARSRAFTLRTRRQGAIFGLAGGILIIGVAVALAIGLGQHFFALIEAPAAVDRG